MATDNVNPAEEDPKGDLPTETDQPSEETEEATETVEELQAKLAAAEQEAKTWKGRAEKSTKDKPKTKVDVTEEDIDWKIQNANRISLVKEAYDKELQDLQDSGVKLTNSLREKALNYAESTTGVTKKPVSEPLPEAGIDRTEGAKPSLTEYDRAMNVKPEIKEKYGEYVEGV